MLRKKSQSKVRNSAAKQWRFPQNGRKTGIVYNTKLMVRISKQGQTGTEKFTVVTVDEGSM